MSNIRGVWVVFIVTMLYVILAFIARNGDTDRSPVSDLVYTVCHHPIYGTLGINELTSFLYSYIRLVGRFCLVVYKQ